MFNKWVMWVLDYTIHCRCYTMLYRYTVYFFFLFLFVLLLDIQAYYLKTAKQTTSR